MEAAFMSLLTGGITMGGLITITQLVIVFFMALQVKNLVTNYLNYRAIISNRRIAIGTQLKFSASYGSVDVKITEININGVLLENNEIVITVPTVEFAQMIKIIIKSPADIKC